MLVTYRKKPQVVNVNLRPERLPQTSEALCLHYPTPNAGHPRPLA